VLSVEQVLSEKLERFNIGGQADIPYKLSGIWIMDITSEVEIMDIASWDSMYMTWRQVGEPRTKARRTSRDYNKGEGKKELRNLKLR
jgi:hypothetical protein